jgi:hypothetical protein
MELAAAYADATVCLVSSVLTRLGYFVNLKKFHLLPSPSLVWLGFLVYTILGTFSYQRRNLRSFLASSRISSLQALFQSSLERDSLEVRLPQTGSPGCHALH